MSISRKPGRSGHQQIEAAKPDEAETEMGGNRSSETSEDTFKSSPEKRRTAGAGKPTARWKEAQDVEYQEGVPKQRSRLQGGRAANMPANHDSPERKTD